jgi:hypothetical protein
MALLLLKFNRPKLCRCRRLILSLPFGPEETIPDAVLARSKGMSLDSSSLGEEFQVAVIPKEGLPASSSLLIETHHGFSSVMSNSADELEPALPALFRFSSVIEKPDLWTWI